jgi:hypothetical protein
MVIEGPADVLHDRRVEREVLGGVLDAREGPATPNGASDAQEGLGRRSRVLTGQLGSFDETLPVTR